MEYDGGEYLIKENFFIAKQFINNYKKPVTV